MTRADWLTQHRVTLTFNEAFKVRPWTAWSQKWPRVVAYGSSENEALGALAGKLKLRIWA